MITEDKIHCMLYEIWLSLLGEVEITFNSNFLKLGGDEFLFSALKDAINKKFMLTSLPTSTDNQYLFYAQVDSIKKTLSIQDNSIITSLNSEKNKPVIVFVHPLGGTIFSYKKLATHLNVKNKIIGIQENFLSGSVRLYKSLEEQAKFYNERIREHTDSNELILIGHSSGGTIAFEMATQLIAIKYKINKLILLDSWVDIPIDIMLKNSFKKIMLRQFKQINPDMLSVTKFNMDNWVATLWQRMDLLMQYKPGNLNVNTSLLIAKEPTPDYTPAKSLSETWGKYINNLDSHFVNGNHENMLKENNLNKIASLIKKLIPEVN